MSKKGRFYIQIKEIFDNGFALGSMQDYVDIMNDLDKQNENKGKQIAELQQQLAEKDKQIQDLSIELSKQAQNYIDADKKLIEKDKEITELKQTINTLQQNTISASVDDVNLIHELENQLAEKDKEIAELKKQLHHQRHQICDRIREKLKKCVTPACGTYIVYYGAKNVDDTLDQIEKGEE